MVEWRNKVSYNLVIIGSGNGLGTRTLSEPMLIYWQMNHREQITSTFWSKYNIFFVENAFENVFKCQSVGSGLDGLICYDEWQFVFTRNAFE